MEKRSPYRHLARTVPEDRLISDDDLAHTSGGKDAAVPLRDCSDVRQLGGQRRSNRAIAFALSAVARGAVSAVDVYAFQGDNEATARIVRRMLHLVIWRRACCGAETRQQNSALQTHKINTGLRCFHDSDSWN